MKVQELLSALGSTSDKVAESLRAKGIKGKQCMGKDCPLANYLKACGVQSPIVSQGGVWSDSSAREAINDACGAFIGFFDCGRYPDLIG